MKTDPDLNPGCPHLTMTVRRIMIILSIMIGNLLLLHRHNYLNVCVMLLQPRLQLIQLTPDPGHLILAAAPLLQEQQNKTQQVQHQPAVMS